MWSKKALFVLVLAILSAHTFAAQSQKQYGVVVEDVAKDSAGASAGLQPGDVILSWSRGAVGGKIESPFDWVDIQIEEVPRGPITFEGERETHDRRWTLSNSASGITIAPVLKPDLKALWQHCRNLEKADRLLEAAEPVRTMMSQITTGDPAWLSTWLQYQLEKCLSRARRFDEADAAFQKAIERARVGAPRAAEHLLRALCESLSNRGKWARAEACFQDSLKESRRLGSSLGEAANLHDMGLAAWYRADLDEAEKYDEQALTIRQNLAAGSLIVAASLNNLGIVAHERGNLDGAQDYYQRALAIRENLARGSPDLAGSLNQMGILMKDRGDLEQAEEYYHQALAVERGIGAGTLAVASVLGNLGVIADERGDLTKAEDYHRQALTIEENLVPASRDVAGTLINLGTVAEERGDLPGAEEFDLRALAIEQKLAPNNLDVAAILENLGVVAHDHKNLDSAERYYQRALTIRQKLAPDSLDLAQTLDNLGGISKDRGDFGYAQKYHEQSLSIEKKVAPSGLNFAETLHYLGDLALDQGNLVLAQRYNQRALVIAQKLAPGSLDEATTLYSLGLGLQKTGEITAATHQFAKAVDALETQTAHLGGTEEIRSSFRAKFATWYLHYEDILLTENRPQDAFQVSERCRARSFLRMLAERDLAFANDVTLEFQRARKRNAAEYDRVQSQIAELSPAKDQRKIDELLGRLRELSGEREQIAGQIKKTSPHFASLQFPEPLDPDRTRQVLDPGTTLLSYSVGEDHTILFVVQPAGSEPGLSVFTVPVKEKDLQRKVEQFRRLIEQRRSGSDHDMMASSRGIYDLLLKPAESLVTRSDRLLIVPDGPLQVLPFAALLRNPDQYLIEWKPLHTVVSATVYAELKKTRPAVENKDVELVAFGDPHIPESKNSLERSANAELRFASERGFTFGRLPFSRKEVQGIAALYPQHSRIYLAGDATEEHAKALGRNVRYIHFATHGLLDERFPLNSALVLTIPEKAAEGQENGLLQAWEIFEQVRIDADLVALSACNSGLGQQMTGEGLIGLTRAFHYAGARSVLASLWSVDDFRTMQLMEHFYRRLRAGSPKDEALRQAQSDLLHSHSSSSPYYWAAFSLSGDWR